MENAIDAGARNPEIQFEQGTLVQSDGRWYWYECRGSDPSPFHRHATSKIHAPEDLWNLSVLAFGEAMASIGSVELRLYPVSRNQNLPPNTMQFGQLSEVSFVVETREQQFLVEELLTMFPARRKFLKSDTAEVFADKNMIKAFGFVPS